MSAIQWNSFADLPRKCSRVAVLWSDGNVTYFQWDEIDEQNIARKIDSGQIVFAKGWAYRENPYSKLQNLRRIQYKLMDVCNIAASMAELGDIEYDTNALLSGVNQQVLDLESELKIRS